MVAQETKLRLAQETSDLLLRKLKKKLDKEPSARGALEPSTSLLPSSVTAEAEVEGKEAVSNTEETRQQLTRTLDDRKTYMIETLQMEIALMIHQHKIVDDYQSPVNGPMYSEPPHRCAHYPRCITHTTDNSLLPPPSSHLLPITEPHTHAPRLQSRCASSRRSASANSRSRTTHMPSTSCFF